MAPSPGVASLLTLLARLVGAKAAVEIGTGAGVSGLAIIDGLTADGILTSIDIEPEHQRVARETFTALGFDHTRARLIAGRALDVGSGEGADAIWLAERGWRVTASDISANALARVGAEAERRGVAVDLLHRDANALDAYEAGTYDLVSLQYGSFLRTPDGRGLRNLLGAVAPGGTLQRIS